MDNPTPASIFARYYSRTALTDRYDSDPGDAVDVMIPLFTVNEFFHANLSSFYAEIPVNRLLIGDGGCDEETLAILREFPRVVLIDQKNLKTLGYCLKQLFEAIETEWFVYLHADVLLPPGWFDAMCKHRSSYDWFECNRRKTVLLDYPETWQNDQERPYSGSQMGKKEAFAPFLHQIDDDYLYRNEDLVFRDLVEKHGGKYARIQDTYHFHQFTNTFGLEKPDLEKVEITPARSADWMKKTYDMQARGLIKYTRPGERYIEENLANSLVMMDRWNCLDKKEFMRWTGETNPLWLPFVKKTIRVYSGKKGKVLVEMKKIARSVIEIFRTLFAGSK